MAWKVSPDPVDFDEAIAWFRKRVPMTRPEYERLTAEAKARAFWISHVAQVDVVAHAMKAIDKAVAEGTTLADFKKAVGDELRRAWGDSVDDHAWRLETIFRQNVQNAYSAGRHRQATHPDVLGDRPVWMFDAILDDRTTHICKACDGTKLDATDKWWQTHQPPLHFNCRSGFITLTPDQAGTLSKAPNVAPPEGFGAPMQVDDPWTPEPGRVPEQLEFDFSEKTKDPPKPPAARLVAGVHVLKASAGKGVPKDAVDEFLGSVTDAGLVKYLEEVPLNVLRIPNQARSRRKAVNGWYLQGPFRELEVSYSRGPGNWGADLSKGRVHSVSTAGASEAIARLRTFTHELAHHIHKATWKGGAPPTDAEREIDGIIRDAYAKATKKDSFLTAYASTISSEYWAECFAAYWHERKLLKERDPDGFVMVEKVLKLRGIL